MRKLDSDHWVFTKTPAINKIKLKVETNANNRIQILLIILLLNIYSFNAQGLKSELTSDSKLEAVKIIELPNKNVEDIYKQVLKWTLYAFSNSEIVYQTNVQNEMIKLAVDSKGVIPGAPFGSKYGFGYIIIIELKDSKIRFRMFDMVLIGVDPRKTRRPMEGILLKNNGELKTSKKHLKFKNVIDDEINKIYQSLIESSISNKEKDSDW